MLDRPESMGLVMICGVGFFIDVAAPVDVAKSDSQIYLVFRCKVALLIFVLYKFHFKKELYFGLCL